MDQFFDKLKTMKTCLLILLILEKFALYQGKYNMPLSYFVARQNMTPTRKEIKSHKCQMGGFVHKEIKPTDNSELIKALGYESPLELVNLKLKV